jgi:hypothetical protein
MRRRQRLVERGQQLSNRSAYFADQRAALVEINRLRPGPDAPYLDAGTQMRLAAAEAPEEFIELLACIEQQVPLVNIVRKPDQEEMLRAAGAVHVCNSASAGFLAELTGALTATGATLAFDAIGGGRLASQILTGMEAAAAAGSYSRYGSAVHKQGLHLRIA